MHSPFPAGLCHYLIGVVDIPMHVGLDPEKIVFLLLISEGD